MVTIKQIHIENFFGKGTFEWDLNPLVNILGGKNGSGKSSAFTACYDIMSSEHLSDAKNRQLENWCTKIIVTLSNDWTLTWENTDKVGTLDISRGSVAVDAAVICDNTGAKRSLKDVEGEIDVHLINSFEQHLSNAISYDRQPKTQKLDDPTMLDLMIKDQVDKRNRQNTAVMEKYLSGPEDNMQELSAYKQQFMKLFAVLAAFLTGYEKAFNSDFQFTKGGKTFGYEHLSMGEKQILLLLLMVANTQQQKCIFFMDEPDLSMHIDWKEILIKQLHELNPNMQIILSTHAPSVITGWMDCTKEVNELIK